ncbi:4-hydroxybenzoate 3-monooxygenase [Nocardia jejuensis]|uniref:4-hydroxybenzoate 3-monooxygenase n=1 Tax=Nocardia jejuensis TaxID=328049 RepID=UPI000A0487CB|nr:4-hydroxybenzoate 3-monooxygenase [Nocardia jejuensis]
MRSNESYPTSAVVVLGAGPAGLTLANILQSHGVDSVVLERRSETQVRNSARAGYLAPDSVAILREHGLADGLDTHGHEHDRCEFRSAAGRIELHYSRLGSGRPHTVYPQQHLVSDLITQYRARGGTLRFDTTVEHIDHTGEHIHVHARDHTARALRFTGSYAAGCDGSRGVSRTALAGTVTTTDHGVTWLALLAQAPPASASVIYGVHADGFAGHMPRTAEITRYYLQCDPDTDPDALAEDQIWTHLRTRLQTPGSPPLPTGPIIERALVRLRSEIVDPIGSGRLFLVGDAATSISPSAAKGANLAIVGAQLLARALLHAVREGDDSALRRYSQEHLPRIHRAHEFSQWMIELLHPPAATHPDAPYLGTMQRARLHNLATSRVHQDFFAQNYVGI